MADGLLNKASIILTPTGYKAGTLYNVAPVVEPYEDFDFARASVASRVNSSGLVEMVGRTLGSELVTNGDFSNGTTDWTNASSDTFEVVDGGVGHSTSLHIVVSAVNRGAYQSVFVADKTYYVSLDLKVVSGSVYIGKNTRKLNNQNYNNSDWQTITGYLVAIDDKIRIYSNEASEFYVDNVSVKEVIDTNNIPRISYDSNGENGHILLEPTSTNLITYSEDFSEWASSNATLESGFLAPDGSNSAYKVSGTVGSTTVYFAGVPNLSSTSTRTIWARTVSGTGTINLCSYGQNTNNNFTITEEWQRFEVNGTTTSTGESNFYAVDFRFEESNPLREVIIWGAQAENLTYATSYIPTLTGSTVTRAAETLTGSGNSTLINSTEGVLYAEIAALADDSDIKGISLGKLGTNVTTNGVAFYFFDNNLRARAYDSDYTLNGGIYFEATKTSINTNTFYKVAISWDSNGGKMYVDGALITPTRNLSGYGFAANYFNSLNFYRNSNDVFEGKCKALAVFNEALTDDELENLTS